MILHPPFMISARLLPALRLADGVLSLDKLEAERDGIFGGQRHRATFWLDAPGLEYMDRELRSGVGGFKSPVQAFEGFLAFLDAAVESLRWERDNPGRKGENTDAFPIKVVEWAMHNHMEIEAVRLDLYEDYEHGRVNLGLIQ